MRDVKIQLNSTEEIMRFNRMITKYPCDFDLEVGQSYIDAKSLLGIYSLSLNRVLTLHIQAEKQMADEVVKNLDEFICKEEVVTV